MQRRDLESPLLWSRIYMFLYIPNQSHKKWAITAEKTIMEIRKRVGCVYWLFTDLSIQGVPQGHTALLFACLYLIPTGFVVFRRHQWFVFKTV